MPGVCAARQLRSSSHRRSEALAGAPLDNAPKEYPPKIQQLVQDIASLTLLEISDLNELLKVLEEIGTDQDQGSCPLFVLLPNKGQTSLSLLVCFGSLVNYQMCFPRW